MFKKVYVVLLVAVLTAGYAQAQFTFGVRAGFNLTNISQKYDGTKASGDDKGKFKPGFQIGVVGEYALGESFAIQPGILFATQGTKFKFTDEAEITETFSLNYIQVPINAQYRIDLGGAKLLLQAGPYLGYAIGGKDKYEAGGASESDDIEFGSKDEEINPFDFGLGLGAGVQFSNFQVGLGYNLGLTNLSNVDRVKLKNNGLALTLTYLFGK
jgi:hypothetical protein